MKIIFSRKGFDSKNGGVASPIFTDETLRSLPIPLGRGRPLGDCYRGATPCLAEVVSHLTGGQSNADSVIHLDPDLCADALARKAGWLPTFGQEAASQTRLANWEVGTGDIFLFFGWFKRVERHRGRWRFVRQTPSIHCFFGWLQVGEVLPVPADVTELVTARPWLADHPHIDPWFARAHARLHNTVYITTPELTIDGRALGIAGGGTFPSWTEDLQLTAKDRTRSKWRVPKWLRPDGVRPAFGAHAEGSLWEELPGDTDHILLHSIPIGQEFVLDAAHYPEAAPWLENLLKKHAPPLGGRRDERC